MGWKTQDAYDTANEAERKALPWRKRYNWPRLAWLAVPFIIIAVLFALTRM